MSDSWKESNIKKPVINANKIFTNKLVSKSGVFHNDLTDVCFNDISLDLVKNIVVNNVKSLTTDTSMKTHILKANVIDLADDLNFITIENSIYSEKASGIHTLIGTDISSNNMQSKDTSINTINSLGSNINFVNDVSFNENVNANNIDVSYLSSNNPSIKIQDDVSIIGHLKAANIKTNTIQGMKPTILIDGSVDINGKVNTTDISVNNSLIANKLYINDISSVNKLIIHSDLSFNNNLQINDISLDNIYSLSTNTIFINKDISFNNLKIGEDLSFNGFISPIDNCLTVIGNLTFNKNVTTNEIKADKISLHSSSTDSSSIIFNSDVVINGGIYAKMPYIYKAEVVNTLEQFRSKRKDQSLKIGALILLTPSEDDEIYTISSLEDFKVNTDISIVRPTSPKTTLYIKTTGSSTVKVTTINRDVSWNSITMRNKIDYADYDICYTRYIDNSNEIWNDVTTDLSHTFDISTSTLTGIKNGVRNDDSFNRVYYFDLSASDPENFDVSYLMATIHDDIPSDNVNIIDFSKITLEKYQHDDISKTRVALMTPYSLFTDPLSPSDLSFNVAAHDNNNYVIKTVYLKVKGTVKPREPSWNEIRLETYDVCGENINGHTRHYLDNSWNKYSSPSISTANTSNASHKFDISLNRFFGVYRNELDYHIDLSAIYPETDLDLSFNISTSSSGIGTHNLNEFVSLSGNRIILESNLQDICNNSDYFNNSDYTEINNITPGAFKDLSINIIAHNYYQFGGQDASFDFSAAKQDGYRDVTIPPNYDTVSYSKDVSRNIVLSVVDIITNKPPYWQKIQNISISYEGYSGWDASFYSDYSFNNEFDDISARRPIILEYVSSSYVYYIWDTSTVNDISSLQYRIDLSALDPEGFKVDFSYLPITDNSYVVRINSSNELLLTTPGARDISTNDLSLVIWPQDGGTLPDGSYSDISKNLLFHPFLYKFTEFTFTNCDASGRLGPTFSQCKDWYSNRYNGEYSTSVLEFNKDLNSLDLWWNKSDYFNMNNDNGIQIWTVPATGLYNITIAGAGGGRAGSNQGHGLVIDFSYELVKGDKYMLLIGQKGRLGQNFIANQITEGFSTGLATSLPFSSSGGGGTFMVKGDTLPDANQLTEDAFIKDRIDNSNIIVAVAGGGSGGQTYKLDPSEYGGVANIKSVADASLNGELTGIDGSGITTSIDNPQNTGGSRGQGGRGGQSRTNLNDAASGGGGGGGYATDGGVSAVNTGHDYVDNNEPTLPAKSFLAGGTGGFISYIVVDGRENKSGVGNAQEGGFGGGASGSEGGSGGGGGYSGGGSDYIGSGTYTIVETDKTIAGGGGSFVNKKILEYNPNIQQQATYNATDTKNNYNGYITIIFNPYNKI